MKRIFLVLAVCFSLFSIADAQHFAIGIKADGTANTITGQTFSSQLNVGFNAGIFGVIGLGSFYIEPEVLFAQGNIGTVQDSSGVIYNNSLTKASQIKMNYLSIPVLLGLKLSKAFSIQAGPQYSILLNQNESLKQNGEDAFKSGDFALVGGIQIKVTKVRVYARYVLGLTDISNVSDQQKWQSQSIQVGIGFAIL
ncbi:MAG TPA: porin family protein [Ferruginibacter sp.]|nr:porin family protein [Ferruginibacter sp.]